jgi:hypothetical protein
MAHYINYHPIICYWFNEFLGVLFDMELSSPTKSLVTEAYVVRANFYDENYSFAEIITSGRDGIINKASKQRNQERGKSRVVKARYIYFLWDYKPFDPGTSPRRGDGAPSDPSSHKGQRFTNMYGVPWPLFQEMSEEFEKWCLKNNKE